jgi:hypothetical protein
MLCCGTSRIGPIPTGDSTSAPRAATADDPRKFSLINLPLIFTRHLSVKTRILGRSLGLSKFGVSMPGQTVPELLPEMVRDDARLAPGAPGSPALASALEAAAAAIARLDSAVAHHPLAAAWAYRARLDAVRRQAAVDGKAIDPWHLAALIEGVRLRLDPAAALIDRGAMFDAARHASGLYRWFSRPDDAQQAAIGKAEVHLARVADSHSPLLGAAYAAHAWLDQGDERPPLRAALALYWVRRGVTTLPCPLFTGAAALTAEVPWKREIWIRHFLQALAGEAADGLALLRLIERSWFAARRAVAGRRRDSRAGQAIDLLAAAPLVSATSLAELLGISIKNAIRLLDGFVVLGIVTEITHRAKRRLYGLKHLAPLGEATAPPRRPVPGRRPGRPSVAMMSATIDARPSHPPQPLVPSPPLPALHQREFDFSDIDNLLELTDQAIRRAQARLKEFGVSS